MSYFTKQDSITGRTYYQLNDNIIDQEIISKIDFSNLVIASHNNLTRFLLNDATMVMAKTIDPFALHAALMTYAPNNTKFATNELIKNTITVGIQHLVHAYIKIDCLHCDKDHSHNYTYDFNPSGHITNISRSLAGDDITLQFHLNHQQAVGMLNSLSFIHDQHTKGLYKYIPNFQDCVSLPINSYRGSGLPHHLSDFYTDAELLSYENIGKTIFKDKILHFNNPTDPNRHQVSAFMKEVYGDDYAIKWSGSVTTNENNTAIEEDGASDLTVISDLTIDYEKAMANTAIKARIAELTHIRKDAYAEFAKIWDKEQKLTEADFKPFIERNFTNEELYYTYTLKYEVEQHKIFTQLPYVQYLELNPFGTDIVKSCLMKNNYQFAPVCRIICEKLVDTVITEEDMAETIEYFCGNWQENGLCLQESDTCFLSEHYY